jgi:hypothetical protein
MNKELQIKYDLRGVHFINILRASADFLTTSLFRDARTQNAKASEHLS